MSNKELITRIKGVAYVDVYLVTGGRIIDHLIEEDVGQRWLISRKLNKAFILPDRSEGLYYDRKTIFFYGAETSTPLTIEEQTEIEHQDAEYMFGIDDNNKLVRTYNRAIKNPDKLIRINEHTRKVKPAKIVGTTMEPQVLKAIIDTKIISELLKPIENKWEQLKIPIIIGIVAITGLVMFYTM